ncbi:MAG: ROK family protein, partial [Microbacterium gubbeenense]
IRTLALAVDPERIVIGGGIARLGDRLLAPVIGELERAANGSAFLGSLRLAARIELLPRGVPIGAIGAALSDARSAAIGVGAG